MNVLVLVLLARPLQADAWAQLWTELELLRSGKVSPAEADMFRAHLGEALTEADGPRAELLRAALQSLSGRDASAVAMRLAAEHPGSFSAREQWFLADMLPPGLERARTVLAALEAPTTLTDWQVLLAWNVAVDEARALRLEESALPIQHELHERYQAPWSAEDLALTYKALDLREAADRVLARAIELEEAAGRRPAGLWEKRGINALGFGDEAKARDYLGMALALGSDDASLLLGRMELMAGRNEAARPAFRALILRSPPPDWAWRGWGMALLPSAFAAQTKTAPPPFE